MLFSPVFGFDSAYNGLFWNYSYLLQFLVSDTNIEPTVIKDANQLVSF